jgi:hypothetical protein
MKVCEACSCQFTDWSTLCGEVYLPDETIMMLCYLCRALVQSGLPSVNEE